MDPRTLESLILRLPDGDLEALEGLYRELHPAVLAYSRLLLGDPGLAEDNAQDSFLRIWEKASTYRPDGRPRAWMMAIARNAALDRIRRAGREIPVDDVAEEDLAEDGSETRAAESLDLRAALRTLEPADRRIVLLRAVAGMTHKEVAGLTGLPASTVHWRYRRALARLGDLLEGGKTR